MNPYSLHTKSIIAACHFTGIFDVNRNTILLNDDYNYVEDWVNSITALGLTGIIFHNHFTEQTCSKHQTENIHFIKKTYNPIFNPNVFRYFVYKEFLETTAKQIEYIFFTDIGDVEVINNPFIQPLFLQNPITIFCGDEPKLLNNEWMMEHSNHLRNRIEDYANYEESFKNSTLLNCGVVGGYTNIIQPFINDLCQIHQKYNADNSTPYTGDMGAFNYLIRIKYNQNILHGKPINTTFKAYESDRKDCWFRHK
jgi:hypothetical protein